MSFNGSGVFNINTTGQPVVTGTVISSSTFNTLTADLATGLSTCLTKDGQSTPTANIKLGGYKLTGLGAPSGSGDALSFGNVATISTLTLTNPLTGGNGGTGLSAFTSGGAVYATSTSALTTGTLPVASGGTGATTLTANNVLLGNGTSAVSFVAPGSTGNLLTSNGTTWTSAAAISIAPDVIVADEKTNGTTGTSYTASSWQTVTLNTVNRNAASIGSLSGNALTLPAGTWLLRGFVPFIGTSATYAVIGRARLYNNTDSSVIAQGSNARAPQDAAGAFSGSVMSEVVGVVTLASSKAIILQIYPNATALGGNAVSSGQAEVYAQLEATRVA